MDITLTPFQVLGARYSVIIIDEPTPECIFGNISYDHQTITLCTQPQARKIHDRCVITTLFHELAHAVGAELAIKFKDEELFCDWFSNMCMWRLATHARIMEMDSAWNMFPHEEAVGITEAQFKIFCEAFQYMVNENERNILECATKTNRGE